MSQEVNRENIQKELRIITEVLAFALERLGGSLVITMEQIEAGVDGEIDMNIDDETSSIVVGLS